MTPTSLRSGAVLAFTVAAIASSCAAPEPTPTAGPTASAAAEPSPASPSARAREVGDIGGAHNVWVLSGRVISGSQPEGAPAFEALAKMGVRTVLSVDGAKPDVETAGRFGLRYVHLPIGYDGIERDRAVQIARVVSELPGPTYVHCHHGRHRGPAAAATALVACEGWTNEEAVAQMKKMGTSPKYVGLYADVGELARPAAEELARVDAASLPSTAEVPPLAGAMVDIDLTWANLEDVKREDWNPPRNHPDVDPPHEALQLGEQLTELGRTDEVAAEPEDFRAWLADAAAAAADLERALRAGDHAAAAAAFDRVDASCTACHAKYRNVK